MASVRTYITETEFAKIDNPQSSTTYIVLDDNDPTSVKKVVFKTNNINHEGEVYIVQDEFPTPSGAISITANGENIDVKQYATANVNVPNPSTGTLNITANNDYDVTDYAGVSVNVPNPSTGTLNITNNATYDVKNYAFAEVNVPNPSTGILNITSNDTYDVTEYAGVSVNVPQPSGKITISQNGTDIDIAQYAVADVNVSTGEQKTCKFKFAGNGNFTFNKLGDGKYYLKKNDGEWTEYTTSQTVSVVNGDVIELKSDLMPLPGQIIPYNSSNTHDVMQVMRFESSLSFELEGDLLGTLFGDTLPVGGAAQMFRNATNISKVPNDMFANYSIIPNFFCVEMFAFCHLTTAPALPATTIGIQGCYRMFFWNRQLTSVPVLSATNLYRECYYEMFKQCDSLTTAPELPATVLADGCYNAMFDSCTGLTSAPALPATTLAQSCYYGMFYGCTSLTTAPELPATTLTNECYRWMFDGCSSLNYVKCLATNISASKCTGSWLNSVDATGTFVKDATMTNWTTGANGIPSGWTVEDAA